MEEENISKFRRIENITVMNKEYTKMLAAAADSVFLVVKESFIYPSNTNYDENPTNPRIMACADQS